MPYRIIVELENTTVRSALRRGETLIGSSRESDLRIPHYTVSRKHAIVRVDQHLCEIEDLGSSNGTTVDGCRIERATPLRASSMISLGSASCRLEEVADDDMEAALAAPGEQRRMQPIVEADTSDPTTLSLGSLRAITLGRLPALLADIAEGADLSETAHGVGTTLVNELPCRLLEIWREHGQTRSILFSAGDGTILAEEGLTVPTAQPEIHLRIVLPHKNQERAWEPLVRAMALLVGLGTSSRPRSKKGNSPGRKLAVPDPPSVVASVRKIYEDASRVARSDIGVLIRGESGTGKEVLARFIHESSGRDPAKFIPLNCAALPHDLLEAELFGIEKGVATGVEPRPGKFELADNGTLFLDEIGDMATPTQAKILRVLQEKEVFRLGAATPHPARVRIISATNQDLDAAAAAGTFRSDLYHRIADWVVELPPLRLRQDDIPTLAVHFLALACRARGIHTPGITRAAVDALAAYRWPGNIRQLEREMSRAALFLEDGEALDTSRLKPEILERHATPIETTLDAIMKRTEEQVIRRAIETCGGDMPAAASLLGVPRSTFYRKLKMLGIAGGQADALRGGRRHSGTEKGPVRDPSP